MSGKLALGLDLSTQSMTAAVIDVAGRKLVYEKSLDYLADPRLNVFGTGDDYLLPAAEPGEANQPVGLFLAAVDAIMQDLAEEMPRKGLALSDVAVVNFSVQQHGHVYLGGKASPLFALLRKRDVSEKGTLGELLEGAFTLPFAKTWRTASTGRQADFVRGRVGGKDALIGLSGSDAPLRFSAFSVRKTAQDFPGEYAKTVRIHQLNSLLGAVFTGNVEVPLDYGNACGFSLMDYRRRAWSEELAAAVSDGIPGGAQALLGRLPMLASAKTAAGTVAGYFVGKYGMNPACLVGVGSGDNAQSKVLYGGTLLSLGTSLVLMAEFDGESFDFSGSANAMYDGLDRPFMFGCRTNGALRWDEIRLQHGLGRSEFEPAEEALERIPPGGVGGIFLWQAETESFPRSAPFEPVRTGYDKPDFARDYAGLVDSTLGILYLYSRPFTTDAPEIRVTGGPAQSSGILRRIAAIWDRTVIPLSGGGAALGAVISGACALPDLGGGFDAEKFASSFLEAGEPVVPREEDLRACRAAGGYLDRLDELYSKTISRGV